MNVLTDFIHLDHKFVFIESTKYFNRYKCLNCNLPISHRIDDDATYGVTTSEENSLLEIINWEILTCNEIIIKNIIE